MAKNPYQGFTAASQLSRDAWQLGHDSRDAEVAALRGQLAELRAAGDKLAEALKALPLAVFEKEMQSCDAAEFSDYAADFYDAMTKARPALFAWEQKRGGDNSKPTWAATIKVQTERSNCIPDGSPCSHPGCLSHISHPCEGCGRVGGQARKGE